MHLLFGIIASLVLIAAPLGCALRIRQVPPWILLTSVVAFLHISALWFDVVEIMIAAMIGGTLTFVLERSSWPRDTDTNWRFVVAIFLCVTLLVAIITGPKLRGAMKIGRDFKQMQESRQGGTVEGHP